MFPKEILHFPLRLPPLAVCLIFTIPIVLSYSLVYFANHSGQEPIQLPVLKTIIQIMGITIIPVSIGMLIKKFKMILLLKMERPMRIASTAILFW
ncbi:MAG: hypothetical protein R2728_13435 [Chitinophagales bacterium]